MSFGAGRFAALGGLVLAAQAAAYDAEIEIVLSDLPPAVSARVAARPEALSTPGAALQAAFESSQPYEFGTSELRVRTDPRWFQSHPPEGPAAPQLVLRRWPGDTTLALYVLAGPLRLETAPPLPRARCNRVEGPSEQLAEWTGTIQTEYGELPLIWIERTLEGAPNRLGALLLPGDAGWGSRAIVPLTDELRAVLARVEFREPGWHKGKGIEPGQLLTLPKTGEPPGDSDEAGDPWQIVRGAGFTLGVPPGLRARRLDDGVSPPVSIPGARLWMRGRFVDREGAGVAVGDGSRTGYVAEIEKPPASWVAGKNPPLGALRAVPLAGDDFQLAAAESGAKTARAERWREEGFLGEWLVFRLAFADRGVEIALPVLDGRRSPALFWIPATWRGQGKPPAAPPVDPAERFGIRFEQLGAAEKIRQPWIEGFLTLPGLRVALPKGWWPAASLRSKDGFPVQLLDGGGRRLGNLTRLAPEDVPRGEPEGWIDAARPAVQAAGSARRRADGALLLVSKQGHGFLLLPESGETLDRRAREQWEMLVDSVQLMRSEKASGTSPRGKGS